MADKDKKKQVPEPVEAAEEVSEEVAVETPVMENEGIPTTISKGAATTAGPELPEHLRRRRTEIGRVVSDKMEKTVVVSVERSKPHPLYKKVVRQTVKFMAHDEQGSKIGDTVRIMEARPMSKRKRWQVIDIIQRSERV